VWVNLGEIFLNFSLLRLNKKLLSSFQPNFTILILISAHPRLPYRLLSSWQIRQSIRVVLGRFLKGPNVEETIGAVNRDVFKLFKGWSLNF